MIHSLFVFSFFLCSSSTKSKFKCRFSCLFNFFLFVSLFSQLTFRLFPPYCNSLTSQKIKLFIRDFFSKCDQIRSLWCLGRFYESLKGVHKTFRSISNCGFGHICCRNLSRHSDIYEIFCKE